MSTLTEVAESEFDESVLAGEKPTVVDFWAPWCGPCRMVTPELEELAGDRSDVRVVKVNVDEAPGIARRYGIMSIPTVILFKDGEAVGRSVGAKQRHAIEAELGLA